MIPVFKPLLEPEEIQASVSALEMGWLGMGSYVSDFENSIKDYLKADDRYVAAVSTGHAALHIALLIAGVKPGDEVITPSFNNIADFQAILAVGANPVFCDIDETTLCIDLNKAEELVTEKTKAIIVMDYATIMCDHDQVARFQEKYGIRVIHDAAHSFGSEFKGAKIGSFSDICMFSFDPVKTITTIDGGALVVKTKEELKNIHEIRLIGMGQPSELMYKNQRAWTYDVKQLGFRYHMANLHGAIGLAQIAKMPTITETRRATCKYYSESLSHLAGIVVPHSNFDNITPFLFYIRVLKNRREELIAFLKEKGVDTGIHWQPGHWFSLFEKYKRKDLSVTDKIGKEILSLPLHSHMPMEQTKKVVEAIQSFFE